VVFKGGILGGARQFWGNPYLNSTTVLFDNKEENLRSTGMIRMRDKENFNQVTKC